MKYFTPDELLSPDGLKLFNRGIMPLSEAAIHLLEKIREHYNTAFYVNHGWLKLRGFRSPAENFSIYGKHKYTFHYWCAFDVTQDKLTAEEFYWDLRRKKERFHIGGLGLYKSSNFIHIDFRDGHFATWEGR